MGMRMKGIYKGFKYTLSQIFVVKEREMEIGYPTDVKHLAHIGWDGPSGNAAPSWMNEFKTGPDFAATSLGNGNSFSGPFPPWSSQDFSESLRQQTDPEKFEDAGGLSDLPNVKKKQQKRKKSKSTSLASSSMLWSSKSKPNFKTTNIVVS